MTITYSASSAWVRFPKWQWLLALRLVRYASGQSWLTVNQLLRVREFESHSYHVNSLHNQKDYDKLEIEVLLETEGKSL